jgi:hypothetical protein
MVTISSLIVGVSCQHRVDVDGNSQSLNENDFKLEKDESLLFFLLMLNEALREPLTPLGQGHIPTFVFRRFRP